MADVEGVKAVIAKLESIGKRPTREVVVVGYTQRYAVIVHEDLLAKHKVGHAKYLEAPARGLSKELGRIIQVAYKKTGDIVQSLLLAGFRLLRESQKVVPVDTSALRASGFVCREKDLSAESAKAFTKSETVRTSAKKSSRKRKKRK